MQVWHTAIDKVANEIDFRYFSNILITYSPPFVSPGEPLASSPEEPLPPPLARDRVLCSSTVCAHSKYMLLVDLLSGIAWFMQPSVSK